VDYVDYIGNVCRLAVELVNADGSLASLSDEARLMFEEHAIAVPADNHAPSPMTTPWLT